MAFKVNQIYSLVNSIAKQSWGATAVTATDLTGIIAMGDKIIDSQTDKEVFMNALINRIGKTIISNRPYKGALRNVVRDTMEYGSIVQKIYVEPFEAEKNTSWDLAKGTPISFGSINPPTAHQYLFEVKDVYQFTVTIPDYQINTAFTSAESLGAFISAIYTSMETTINLSLDNMINACINNFIAEKIWAKNNGVAGVHAIDLLGDYNNLNGTALRPEEAILDVDFLRYAGRVIKLHINRMENLTQLYNTEQLKRHTPKDDLNVFLLSDYASANATYLQSNTFHQELVQLPNYTEVTYWQGIGDNSQFSEVSRVNVTTSLGRAVNMPYIIGFMCDKEALGVMYNRRASTAFYSPYQEITQKYEKIDMGYFNDLTENGLVFYLGTPKS